MTTPDIYRTVLVLGATSAIAQAVMRQLTNPQTKFFLVGRSDSRLKTIAQDLTVRGAKQVETLTIDLADVDTSEKLVKSVQAFSSVIDHVFVAYGALGNHVASIDQPAEALSILTANFTSVVGHLTALTPLLRTQRSGAITVLSSVAGDRGRQSNYFYGAAKGGLSIFLQGLRNYLQPFGVRVVTIKAGFVDTPMTVDFKKGPLWSTPERMAGPIISAMEGLNQEVYIPGFWRMIMIIIRAIPERVFIRLKL